MSWSGGPTPALADWQIEEIHRAFARSPRSITVLELAALHGVSRRTIYRALDRHRGYCEVTPCPVLTPRERCYFHAR